MIYHSNVEELHKHFPKVKVPPSEGIFRLGNTTDKLAFVILPENGGKPLHMSNGYPQEDFEREYVTILTKYYRYPPLTLADEDNNHPQGFTSRIISSEKSLRTRLVTTAIVQTFILLVFTLIILTTFLLARAENVWYIGTAVFAVICLTRIWSTTYSSIREVLNDKTHK